MKKSIIFFIAIALLLSFSLVSFSQVKKPYTIEIRSSKKIDRYTYQFEIWIKSNTAVNITSYQCSFKYNNSIVNSGELKFNYVNNSCQLNNKPITYKLFTLNDLIAFASGPGNDIVKGEKRIGTFTIKNTNEFKKGERINLQWNFDGAEKTIILGNDFEEITNSFNFLK